MLSPLKHRVSSLLRWSERYTHLDMVYFASGSFWGMFGQVVSSILAFGLTLVFANYLSQEVYGTYRYLLSLAGLLNVVTLTGMSQAVAQAVAVGKEGVFRISVRYQLKWNLLLMLILVLLGSYYFLQENFEYTGALFILAVTTPLSAAFNTWGAYLGAKREFRLITLYGIGSTLIYAGGMLAAVFWSGASFVLVAAYATTTTLANILFYFLTVKRFNPPLETDGHATETFRFGRHLTFVGLMGPIAGQIDKIILNHFWGAAPLAVYAIATAVPDRIIPLFKKVVDVGFPKVAMKTPQEIDETFYLRIGQGLLAGFVIGGAWAVVAPYFFTYLMPQYLEAIPYAQLLGLTFIFALPNRYVTVLLNSQKMIRRIYANSSIVNILRISLYLVLGIQGGVLGLIWAQIATMSVGLLINVVVWKYGRTR